MRYKWITIRLAIDVNLVVELFILSVISVITISFIIYITLLIQR